MRVIKTKALISFAVTVKLICIFVFAYAKSQFSHEAAHTVSHFSYAPLRQKCWNRTFFLIIYLLKFFLLDYIKKKSESLM